MEIAHCAGEPSVSAELGRLHDRSDMVARDGDSPAWGRTRAAGNATQGANAAAEPRKAERSTGLAQLARGFVSRS